METTRSIPTLGVLVLSVLLNLLQSLSLVPVIGNVVSLKHGRRTMAGNRHRHILRDSRAPPGKRAIIADMERHGFEAGVMSRRSLLLCHPTLRGRHTIPRRAMLRN